MDPLKKPVLSAHTSMMFGPSRTVRIPPPRQKFTVLRLLPEQTVESVKPKPSSYLPHSCPKELGEKVQEVPREGKEDFVETRGRDDGNRAPHSSGNIVLTSRPLETGGLLSSDQCSPAPGDQPPNSSGDSLGGNTQIPRVSSPSERPVVTSEGPAGDVVPLQKPDTDAGMLSDPTPRCPLLQERLTQEVVAENHQPSQRIPDLSRKIREADKPSGIP
ncbi:putative UPF0607 protein FLJ37424 [Lutra lutra]|uniref:putative UPF0607 protein FLJ37424 n=1 Tax=Lutra lutra TaxID=9657 RepID=UPI001FD48D1F|nr:putative UPF0607 protein FLJ37424 [Lutra lutra]